MNNFKKIGLSALAGSLVAVSAHAAEISMSGGASVAITSGDDKGKSTYYQNDSITFTVSGETDGGLSITTSLELDGDASGGAGGDFDSQSLTIGHDTFGTVIFSAHGGSTVMGGFDDMMPTAYEESFALTTGNLVINGAGTGNDLWRYNSPELMPGLTAHIAYSSQNTTANTNAYTDFGVKYAPDMIEGLTLGYATGEVDESTDETTASSVTGIDESTMFVTYTTGPITVGYQTSEADGATTTQDDDSTSFGISYAVTDDLSVSYGEHSLDLGSSTSDQESEGFSASYTMGGTSVKAAFNETTSVAGVNGTDKQSYEIALVFAF
ncbi:porin [Candidatus Pelagibacter sp.]|nr:porin [Candidatus Pelagibacter sp.]